MWFIEQVFNELLSCSGSLATKCVSLNNEACMTIHILFDLNLVELNYYPFMISLDKCNGSCNAVDNLLQLIDNLSTYLQKHVFHLKQKT